MSYTIPFGRGELQDIVEVGGGKLRRQLIQARLPPTILRSIERVVRASRRHQREVGSSQQARNDARGHVVRDR